MIHQVTGAVAGIDGQKLFLFVTNICYEIQVPSGALYKEGDTVTLYIHLHWNQEQGPSLYGFSTLLDRTIFRTIIDCSGVGPKIGIAILKDLGAQVFLAAVQASDVRLLSTVNGIGPKKAEQMLVQLRHKVIKLIESKVIDNIAIAGMHWHEVREALESLHYSRTEIVCAIDYLRVQEERSEPSFDQLMRAALLFLSKQPRNTSL